MFDLSEDTPAHSQRVAIPQRPLNRKIGYSKGRSRSTRDKNVKDDPAGREVRILSHVPVVPGEHRGFPQAGRKRETTLVPGSSGRSASVVGVQAWKRVAAAVCSSSSSTVAARELPTGHRSQTVPGRTCHAVPMIVRIRATSGETDSQID